VAEDDDRYVAAALNLARDIAGLRAGRPALRARMAGSALCDVDAYVQDFQALLQRMWAQHCAGGGGRLLAGASAPTTLR
jgi:predicted O-linked N-acetylglucosamine transferase (SPINDLY family)